MTKFLCLLSIIVVGALGKKLKTNCPPKEDLPNCSCLRNPLWVWCENVLNTNDLKSTIGFLTDYQVEHFRLENSFLKHLPKNLFINFPINELEIHDSEILGLESSDGSETFKGLEKSLDTLHFRNITGLDSWWLSALRILKNLNSLSIRGSDLTKVDKEFALVSPEKAIFIDLEQNKIRSIHPNAFSTHINLEDLMLGYNEISVITRDMFPRPAKNLGSIILRYNQIEVIPKDLFTEMPNLEVVNFESNRLKYLSPEIFLPLEKGQRFTIYIPSNNIQCCSHLKFLTRAKYQEKVYGTCGFPEVLKGKWIVHLEESDFDHGVC